MDIRKFVSKGKHELSDGLFEIFGNYSDEPPHTIRENLLGWIYDFRKIETWFSIMLKQKGVSLSDWAESMCNPKQPGDKLCLYLLCRMYHKHALIHLKHHWWSTIQHALPGELNEILEQCHLELVFVREWVFGEVKQIRKPLSTRVPSPKPLGIMDSSMTIKNTDGTLDQPTVSTTTTQTKTPAVITENASVINSLPMKECNVRIERLPTMMAVPSVSTKSNMSYNMCTRPPKAETLHRTSDCPHAIIDYSQFMSGNEDDTSPPPHKKRTVDLKQTLSSSRIASQNIHTKPSTTPDQSEERSHQLLQNLPVVSKQRLGYDVIPENDITAENSALVPVGLNVPPTVEDNPDITNDSKKDVPSQPTPLHQPLHLHRSHKQIPQTVI